MATKTFNPITETYTISHARDKEKQFENVFDEIARSDDNKDLVLLCGEEKLTFHSEVVAAVFPVIKRFVQNSRSCSCSVYIQKRAEIFVSLDGVNAKTLKQIMDCIYENKPLKFSRQMLGEVRDIFRMLGADDKLFVVEKIESKSKRLEARHGDVFRKVLGMSGALDVGKRKISEEGEDDQIAKKRLVDINMKEEEAEVISKKEVPQKEICLEEESPMVNRVKSLETSITNIDEENKAIEEKNDEPSGAEVKPVELSKSSDSESKLANTPLEKTDLTKPDEQIIPQTPKEVAAAIMAADPKPKDTSLQMILPHLTVTTIKQEPKDSDSNQTPLIKQEPAEAGEGVLANPSDGEGSSTLRCPLAMCSSELVFKARSEILLHLTQAHYTDGLLELYPFNKGQPCKICVDEKKPKVLIAQIKNRFVAHIGVNHEVVLDLLPAELKEVLMVLPKRIKKISTPETSSVSKPPEVDVTLDENPSTANTSTNYPSYPNTNYNYNYPPSASYPSQSYDQSAYPGQSYPGYNSYPQYPPSAPSYPHYNGYSYDLASTGAPVKEETPAAVVKEEPKVEIKQEPLDPDTMFKCTLCTARSFRERSDLLFHLSITHFSRNLNQMYPFKDNQMCPLCNVFKPKNMSSHISHVGLKHEEVLKFLPADLAATLASTGTGVDNMQAKPVEKAEEVPVAVVAPPVDAAVQPTQTKPKPTATAASDEEPTVQCELCRANNKERLFSKRSEFLKHLSLLHFGKALLQAFPYAEGRNCNLCFETSKKMYTPSKKEVHVCHVGVLHAKIFELLPKEILQQVMEMPTMKKVVPSNAPSQQLKKTDQTPPPAPGSSSSTAAPPPQSTFQPPPPPQGELPTQPTTQSFAPPPPPRDVVFKLPGTSLPAKDEFKMPVTKTDKPFNCRYCISGFDNAKDLKDHLLTHKSQFSQINQTPRKMNASLVNLRMNTPRK